MLALEPLGIGANHAHLTIDATILGAGEGVVGGITFASDQQLPGASGFAPNHGWHQERNIKRFEPTDHRDTVKPPVKIEVFNPHLDGRSCEILYIIDNFDGLLIEAIDEKSEAHGQLATCRPVRWQYQLKK